MITFVSSELACYADPIRNDPFIGMNNSDQSASNSPEGHGAPEDKAKQATAMQTTSHDTEDIQRSRDEDAAWVALASQGDMRAFDRLVLKHRGRIYAMILNMVKNDADAWDLSQDVFIKAWKALPRFEARASFGTWLFRISHNVVYDWFRKRRIQTEGELDDELFDATRIDPGAATAPRVSKRPDEALEQTELRQRIDAAIGKLSEEHREVILLREVQGLDYKEIAEVMQISIGTVMSRLHHARKKLQTHLKTEI